VRFIASNALAADLSSTLAMVCALAALALVRDPALWFKDVTILLGALNRHPPAEPGLGGGLAAAAVHSG